MTQQLAPRDTKRGEFSTERRTVASPQRRSSSSHAGTHNSSTHYAMHTHNPAMHARTRTECRETRRRHSAKWRGTSTATPQPAPTRQPHNAAAEQQPRSHQSRHRIQSTVVNTKCCTTSQELHNRHDWTCPHARTRDQKNAKKNAASSRKNAP
jgi:hypothetical protein